MADRLEVSDKTAISMPMKNLLAILSAVGIGVWAFFGIQERLNILETTSKLAEKDLNQVTERLAGDIEKNNQFRIKWPRGEMGSLPADSEQFMLIEHMSGQMEKMQAQLEAMMNNKVNIEFMQKQIEKLQTQVEKLQEEHRTFKAQNGKSY
tara:strand:+ start:163 stop:615 length:453 start_codon:yes stop_codon:yes gene_type:complete